MTTPTPPVRLSQINPEGREAIHQILAYQNDRVLDRYIENEGVSREQAEKVFQGFKQYIVASSFIEGIKTPSMTIDEFWHTFILFMRDYEAFCQENLGEMVYHDPGSDDSGMAFYPVTRVVAEELCGELDEDVWPSEHAPHPNARCISCDSGSARLGKYIMAHA